MWYYLILVQCYRFILLTLYDFFLLLAYWKHYKSFIPVTEEVSSSRYKSWVFSFDPCWLRILFFQPNYYVCYCSPVSLYYSHIISVVWFVKYAAFRNIYLILMCLDKSAENVCMFFLNNQLLKFYNSLDQWLKFQGCS